MKPDKEAKFEVGAVDLIGTVHQVLLERVYGWSRRKQQEEYCLKTVRVSRTHILFSSPENAEHFKSRFSRLGLQRSIRESYVISVNDPGLSFRPFEFTYEGPDALQIEPVVAACHFSPSRQ